MSKKLQHLKTFENFQMKAFFHGSSKELPENTILKPHSESYTRLPESQRLEKILEKYKPSDKLSRYDSVFLVDDIDNIDATGGSIDFIYEVIVPNGIIPEKSDLAWYTELEITDDPEKQKQIAENYWNGVIFYDKECSVMEYRVPKAYIVDLIEEN
jgi:tRNA uridine 5-carbamoylmethylation protein Kti12